MGYLASRIRHIELVRLLLFIRSTPPASGSANGWRLPDISIATLRSTDGGIHARIQRHEILGEYLFYSVHVCKTLLAAVL